MIEKIKNISVVLAVLVGVSVYAYTTLSAHSRTSNYFNRLDKARYDCGQENAAWMDSQYKDCMRRKGFGADPVVEISE